MNSVTGLLDSYFTVAEETIRKEKENEAEINEERKKVIEPILLQLKETVPKEWKKFFDHYFSFEFFTDTKVNDKYSLSSLLIKGMYHAGGAAKEMILFTPDESGAAGFLSREQVHSALPLLTQSWSVFFNFIVEDTSIGPAIFFWIIFSPPEEYFVRQNEFKKSLQKV